MNALRLWIAALKDFVTTSPRDQWDILTQDVSYAIRTLRKAPGFAVTAILTLALGIGANTAIYSVVHAVLLRPLPYQDSARLVMLRHPAQKMGIHDTQFSVPEINDYRAQNQTFSDIAEYHGMSFTLFGHGDPDRVRTGVISANYFPMLGVTPILGRTFTPEDEKHGAPAVLVLSYEYWRDKFGGDPEIVGKTFQMNDKVHTVVGVLPRLPQYPDEDDVYMPTSACPYRSSDDMIQGRGMRMMELFGRLKPGVPLDQARADLATVTGRLNVSYPGDYTPDAGFAVTATPLKAELTDTARPILLALLAAAGFVLLIVCANVANLTLSRVTRRERELAVRSALGAGKIRLLRQLFTESFLLAIVGGGLGLLLANMSLELFTTFAARLTPRAREIHIDAGVLIFTFAAALLTSIVFGTVSAMFSGADISSGLKEGSTGAGLGRSRNRMRSTLIVCQVAFSFVLLVGAGLMLRSLLNLERVNPGFVPEHVLAMRINFNWSKYAGTEQFAAAAKKLVDRVQSEPGVESAAVASNYPLQPELISGGPGTNPFQVEGRLPKAGAQPPLASAEAVSPDYFKVLGIPLQHGRVFEATDDKKHPEVAIINHEMQQRVWQGEDPIGKRISFDQGKSWVEIVGVVGDVREFGLDHAPVAEIFVPMAQNADPATLIVRTAAEPTAMAQQIRNVIRDVDSQTAVTHEMSIEQARRDSLESPRLTASLLGVFAVLALLIAATGIGGIMALAVGQRIRELGIRMALGAQPREILDMVVREGVGMALIGAAIGAAGALALTSLVKSMLFQVSPFDPATFAAVGIVLIGSAFAASYIPARRAASANPMDALRSE
jgi:putative ABC transport system permease protein